MVEGMKLHYLIGEMSMVVIPLMVHSILLDDFMVVVVVVVLVLVVRPRYLNGSQTRRPAGVV